jgi:hypothetical protein
VHIVSAAERHSVGSTSGYGLTTAVAIWHVSAHDGVRDLQHLGRIVTGHRRRPDGMAHLARQDGGVQTVTGYVAFPQ